MTNWERAIRDATAVYRASKGLAPLKSDLGFNIPVSIRNDIERDEDEPDQEDNDWTDDNTYNDPQHTPYSNLRTRR